MGEPWKNRGWSWPSLIAGSVVVGLGMAVISYQGFGDSRGSIIFGAVMALGWLVVFSVAKVVRTRRESENPRTEAEHWLEGHWRVLALFVLLGLLTLLEIGFVATRRWALAGAQIAIASPFVLLLILEQRRQRR